MCILLFIYWKGRNISQITFYSFTLMIIMILRPKKKTILIHIFNSICKRTELLRLETIDEIIGNR